MKRTSKIRPGYDCRTECKHEPPGHHGISSDTWVYSVSDGDRAVSLQVLSADYPAGIDLETLPESLRRPVAAGLFFHVADPKGNPCDLLDGGRCKADGAYDRADLFWRENGDDRQREQPEAFWLALETELPERDAKPEDC